MDWETTEVAIHAKPSGPEVLLIPGANHFLHMIEHVSRGIRERSLRLLHAEDGVANVAARAALEESARERAPTLVAKT